uniref:Matrix remodeling associated 5 n=1 Tax=Pelodiscus sinensis TaxID=13735 RepID=K7F452_PELSI|nr:matrix-remodeling-associated protein 5 isoform X1 [Pelodiscus sinensis]|eukprot:XP_006112308.1 matrix-remodeling-associated protein 5 isoform X1 [Pelodiscus sinensis]
MKTTDKMRKRGNLGALSVVLIVSLGLPQITFACPRPCACYVPTEVHCTFRSLAAVPARISKHVERINLGFNSIQSISENSFAGLTKLELLMIHGNDIQNIPNGALKDLISLQVFKISYNKLKVLTRQTLQGLSNLMRLHMDHNRIEFIHPNAFNGLTSLRLLHLEGNLLQQIHPNTFSTFTFLDYFRLSTVKHLYLSENSIQTLPAGMFQGMPLLENLYLHGNPWSCDCSLKWLLEWEKKSGGVLKCKKDKDYEGGQLCPKCGSPKQLQKQDIQNLKDFACKKPTIQSPFKQDDSIDEEEDGDIYELPKEAFQLSPWNITLNMTDEHGNIVYLNCEIKKPTDSAEIQWNQINAQEIDINTTVSLDFECPMKRENYEKLWKLIAYYSEVPVKLQREFVLSKESKISYEYRQDSDDDALYYTGVKAQILSEPAWVMQPLINIQLNRRQSTGKKVVLSFFTQFSQTIQMKDIRQHRRSWVMIEQPLNSEMAQSVIEGSDCQLRCNVKASESPIIQWVLPDGNKLTAPFNQKDSRFSILSSGQLMIKKMGYTDSGLYHCVAQVRDDIDRMVHRVLVQPPVIQPTDSAVMRVEKNAGEPIVLPCSAVAIPDAQLSWILPSSHVLNVLSNSSKGFVSHNGTLLIPKSHVSDSGYYRCVAVNQQGSDQLAVKVSINKMVSDRSSKRIKMRKRPGLKTSGKRRGGVIEDEGGSGAEVPAEPRHKKNRLKDRETSIKQKNDLVPEVQVKKIKKGRRKMKLWKGTDETQDSNVAEGRRVFESRRRINMSNKQINPQHWANILAKVRGKNLPKPTAGSLMTTLPSVVQKTTAAPSPMAIPSQKPSLDTAANGEESSADVSHLREDKMLSITISPTIIAQDYSADQTTSAQATLMGTETEPSIEIQTLGIPEIIYTVEPSFVGTTYFTPVSPILHAHDQEHVEVKTNYSPVTEENINAVTEEPLDEQITTSLPNTQSSLYTVENATTTTPYTTEESSASPELPVDETGLEEPQTVVNLPTTLETDSQHNEVDADSVNSTPSQGEKVNYIDLIATATISFAVSSFKDFVTGENNIVKHHHEEVPTDQTKITGNAKEETQTDKGLETQVTVFSSNYGSSEGAASEHMPVPKSDSTFPLTTTIAPLKKAEHISSAVLFGNLTTMAKVTTPFRKTTTSNALLTQNPRRRPFGRRRLRPNRFRQRSKPIPSPAFTTEKMPVLEKTSKIEGATRSYPGIIVEGDLKTEAKVQNAKKHNHLEMIASLITEANVVERMTKVRDTEVAFSLRPTVSLPETKHVTLSNVAETPRLPATASIATASSHGGLNKVSATELHLSHIPKQKTTAQYHILVNVSEQNVIKTNYEVPGRKSQAEKTNTPLSAEYINSLFSSGYSVTPEFQEEAHPLDSKVGENGISSRVSQPIPPTVLHSKSAVSTVESFTDLSISDEFQNLSESLKKAPITTPPQQRKIATVSFPFSTTRFQPFTRTETNKPITVPVQNWTKSLSSFWDKKETTSHTFNHDQIAVYTTEKPESPVTSIDFVSFTKPTSPSPSVSSTLHLSTHSPIKENTTISQVRFPETKEVEVDSTTITLSTKQNVFSTSYSNQNRINAQHRQEQFKETIGIRSNNSLLLNPIFPHQSAGMVPIFNQQPALALPKHIPMRGTRRPPYLIMQGSFNHFITHQPLHYTNKPEITAYAAQTTQDRKTYAAPTKPTTTTATPLHRPNPLAPSRFGNQGQIRYNVNSRVFGNNYIPDNRGTGGRLQNQGIPYYPSSGIPFVFNRTRTFSHSGVNPKPLVPSPLDPVNTNEKKAIQVNTMQGTILKVTAVPVAPLFHTSSTTPPTSTTMKSTLPSFISQSIRPQISSNIHSFRSVLNNNQKVPFVPKLGGLMPNNSRVIQSSSKFRAHGERPKITMKGPHSLSVLAETDAVIPCDAVGEPKPLVSWTKVSTGVLMTANTRIQRFEVLKNGTFIIRNVQFQDRGQYLCTAQNLYGVDKMIVLLTVTAQQPKMLVSRYRDTTVYFGDSVAMECQANGIPSPHISWILPDRKILQIVSTTESRIMLHENRTLSIKEATFSDRGVYKCIASNAAGADSIAVRLHIAALPPIIQQEKQENISLPFGHNIHIHCTAKAAPPPSIRWVLFDGTQIRPSQFVNGNLFVFPNGTLYIRNISPKDSGNYECIAANMVGAARRTVQLDVKKQLSNAKITWSSPKRTDVTYGSTLHLDCSASGDPWPQILWRLPSKRMIDSLHSSETRIKVFGNGTLVVHAVTDKDAGDYLCVARNMIGDDYVVLKVNVMMRPAKIEHKNENNHKVMYGGDLKVDCVATGLPNPEISWGLPDGSMINTFMQSDDSGNRAKRYVVFNNGTLYFNDVGLREEGDYTCYAENQIGKDEMRIRVKVVAEPATIRNKTYSVINVPYGDVVTVTCKAKGEPTPRVIWLSPTNRPIPLLSDKYQVYGDGTLLIQKAQRSDSGNYTCVVRNSAGEDRKTVWIQINVQPPKINGHPNTITSVRETAVRESRKLIDCKAEGIPAPRVLWAFPEGVILPAPYFGNRITVHRNGTLDIKGVRQTDSVQLVCIGRNEGGEARLIVQLLVIDHVEKPTFGDPVSERITATAGHSINLNCSVHGNPEPSTSWILSNGTELQRGSHLQRFYHKRNGILHISGLSAVDAGTYRCTARNPGGYAERVVFLRVGLKPEISNQYNNLVSIINGETLQLHCVTQVNHQAHISWTLPNGMVLDGPQAIGRFSLLENGSLIVREASVFDRGTYLCKAMTEYGTSFMNVPVIVIAYPPRITSEPAPVIYARPGNAIKLNCMAIGIPKAEITWELPDKSHLTTGAQSRLYGNKFLHPQGSLIIQQSTQRDAGFYKCTAKNILGSDSKTTYVHIF